jgi:hypothetical protein
MLANNGAPEHANSQLLRVAISAQWKSRFIKNRFKGGDQDKSSRMTIVRA